ncbi:MAG: hypothetical protein ACYC2U_01275 [Candidatus Amoebophilus sp.]
MNLVKEKLTLERNLNLELKKSEALEKTKTVLDNRISNKKIKIRTLKNKVAELEEDKTKIQGKQIELES